MRLIKIILNMHYFIVFIRNRLPHFRLLLSDNKLGSHDDSIRFIQE